MSFRLPLSLIDAIERRVGAMRATHALANRSDVVRLLLTEKLRELEEREAEASS